MDRHAVLAKQSRERPKYDNIENNRQNGRLKLKDGERATEESSSEDKRTLAIAVNFTTSSLLYK
jgi:hypothetical protein